MKNKTIILVSILIAVFIFLSSQLAFAAANTCTSSTGVVTGTDPNFVVTYKPSQNAGAVLYLKYTKNTEASITLTFDVIAPMLSTTDKYRYPMLAGTALSAYTMTITASGNYRIPLPLIPAENRIIANVTFATGAQGGAVVANFVEP